MILIARATNLCTEDRKSVYMSKGVFHSIDESIMRKILCMRDNECDIKIYNRTDPTSVTGITKIGKTIGFAFRTDKS